MRRRQKDLFNSYKIYKKNLNYLLSYAQETFNIQLMY